MNDRLVLTVSNEMFVQLTLVTWNDLLQILDLACAQTAHSGDGVQFFVALATLIYAYVIAEPSRLGHAAVGPPLPGEAEGSPC